ncbi:hypothetical protein EGW08_016296 [Elysia chlorotica]|uniref:PX domain-containing protein n=1 Tax=Elysia chlorotica TaxID=188477 RepID=A0A3S1BAG6_ELYCH|nr:hypothetical protein EGW08_016296 [Elysia chlorotica]
MREIEGIEGSRPTVFNRVELRPKTMKDKRTKYHTKKDKNTPEVNKKENPTGSSQSDTAQTEAIPLPKIIVRDPVIHASWEHGKFTTYQICLRTEHPAFYLHVSAVRRRFSELLWLDDLLKTRNQIAALMPAPPPKRIFSDRFNEDLLRQRMKDMQTYLNKLLKFDEVLSDNAFHLFIQTDLSTAELTDYFDGKLPENIIQEAWANMGHFHSSSLLSKPLSEEPRELAMNEEDDGILSSSDDYAVASPSYSPISTGTSNNNNNNNNNKNNNNHSNKTGSNSDNASAYNSIGHNMENLVETSSSRATRDIA